MLNPQAKLNPKLFDKDLSAAPGRAAQAGVEQAPIRKGFGEGLLAAAEADPRVVGLCADLTESTQMHLFAKKFPERFVEIGVAEQNMVTVASGMAAMGKIPFCSSYAMFSPGRNWEQIRTTICYNDRPVKIVGSHGGVSVGPDGGTHQALEDFALMRVLPNMIVLSPCDAIEAKKATLAAARTNTPVYIRLAREKTPVITTEKTPFEIGKAQIMFKSEIRPARRSIGAGGNLKSLSAFGHLPARSAQAGAQAGETNSQYQIQNSKQRVGIIATGSLLYNALVAARELESEGIAATALNLSTIKPLDEEAVVALAEECGAIVTVEEHQIAGGMGSAVAELLARLRPTPIEFVGVSDQFGQSGAPKELIEEYGMGISHIKGAVTKILQRR